MDSVIAATRALISEIDSTGVYRAANPALVRALGRSEDEVIGRNIRDLHPPEIARVFQERIDTVVAHRRPLDVDDRIDGPDGPVFFHTSLSPIVDRNDPRAPVRSVAIVSQEITARVASEETTRREAKRFRSVFDSVATVAVQGYDSCGATIYWNPASEALYGYTVEEALGKSLLDLIIPEAMGEAVSQEIDQMFATGEPISSGELLLQRKDGSRVPVFSSHALVAVPGERPEMYCLDVDLSELHRSRTLFRTIAEIAPVGIVLS
ncbi:MAG: PAS domain S-box protein, partial [Spirochaetaceae bacterium]